MSFQPVSLCQPRTFDFPCLSYNVNLRGLDGIPQELLDAVCENIYVEFMPPSSHPVVAANAPNHVFIKIDFTQPTEPTGEFIGVRIGMMPDISDPFARDSGFNSYASGHLRVLLVSYKRPSRRSFRAFTSRPLIPTLTLRLVLGALTESELQYFDFDTHSGVTHGWRDFVYQAFFQLANRGYVRHVFDYTWPSRQLQSAEATVEAVLGKQFNRAGDALDVPIRKGRFHSYQRANEELPPYQPRLQENAPG